MAVFHPPNLFVLGMAPGVPARPVYPWSFPWPPQAMLLENAELERQLCIKRGTTCSARAADHDLLLLTSVVTSTCPFVSLTWTGPVHARENPELPTVQRSVYILCEKCVAECNKNHEALLRSLICPIVHRCVTAVGR
jgi:hypothetical protein